MSPIVVINGILLGTFGSIALGLIVVLGLYLYLGGEYPELKRELPTLAISALLFTLGTLAAATSFIGHLKLRPWRWWGQAGVLAAVGVVTAYYLSW